MWPGHAFCATDNGSVNVFKLHGTSLMTACAPARRDDGWYVTPCAVAWRTISVHATWDVFMSCHKLPRAVVAEHALLAFVQYLLAGAGAVAASRGDAQDLDGRRRIE